MQIAEELAAYCRKLKFAALPNEVVESAKYYTLDTLAVTVRGTKETSSRIMQGFVAENSSTGSGGVVIGTKNLAPYQYAALANGTACHALELDDVNNESSLHPGTVIVPACLAACEMTGKGGREFIEGVVVGYEVMIRIGKAIGPRQHYDRGFHPTGTCGVFGAAAAVAKIMGLTREQIAMALGIAGSQAAASLEFLSDGSWTKRMHCGWAAHNGIIASMLAKRGFTGPRSILEGVHGFLHAYSDHADAKKILDKMGESFEILRCSIKPHACCRYMQPPIDGILKLKNEKKIEAADVKKVTLGILKAGFPIVVYPMENKFRPTTTYGAQFSMPFGAALALSYGDVSLDRFNEKNLRAKDILGLAARVQCVENPQIEKLYPKQWAATVEIETKDGATYSTRIDYPKGDPENRLTWDELASKARKLMDSVPLRAKTADLMASIQKLEKEKNISTLAAKLMAE